MAAKLTPQDIVHAIEESRQAFDASRVLQCAVAEFNGPEGVAKELYKDFCQLEPGHNNRIKILLTLVQAMLDFKDEDEDFDRETLMATLKAQMSGDE